MIQNKYFRDGAPRRTQWRYLLRRALSETLCGWL